MLRALAILFVLMNHVNMRLRIAKVPYTAGLPDQLVSSLVWNGQRGVQIFFAISGFLIASTSIKRWGSLSQVRARDFYALRFARIAPLLLALLGVLSILHLMHIRDFVVSLRTGGLGRALIAAVTFHINVLEATRGYLPGSWDILWSLSVEEVFYLFFPLICTLLGRSKRLIILFLAFVVLGPFARTIFTQTNEVWREYSYLGGMDAIALGCLTALLLSEHEISTSMARVFAAIGGTLLILSLAFTNWTREIGLRASGLDMTVIAIATCMIAAAATKVQWTSPPILRPLLMLGRRSYEVYLTHMFIVFALFAVFVAMGHPMNLVPVFFAAVIVISGFAGEAVARFYSEPMNRFLRNRWRDGPDRLGSVVDHG